MRRQCRQHFGRKTSKFIAARFILSHLSRVRDGHVCLFLHPILLRSCLLVFLHRFLFSSSHTFDHLINLLRSEVKSISWCLQLRRGMRRKEKIDAASDSCECFPEAGDRPLGPPADQLCYDEDFPASGYPREEEINV